MNQSNQEERLKKIELSYKKIRDHLVVILEGLDGGTFERKIWKRQPTQIEKTAQKNQNASEETSNGGEMSILRGKVFEKAGVNFSLVKGIMPADAQVPHLDQEGNFWATGVSLVVHPMSPLVPAVHMNIRHIITGLSWFGGGCDITPTFQDKESVEIFHGALKKVCEEYQEGSYERFSKQCDQYFFINHRDEARGEGGIFFDQLNSNDWQKDLTFTENMAKAFGQAYKEIVSNLKDKKWTQEQKQAQLIKRGKYVEFNLIYDRGTLFGLKTNANIDALFMSLPPLASW